RLALIDARFVWRDPVPHLEGHHLLFAVYIEFEAGVNRVRRLLIILEHELPADGADLRRVRDAEPPSRDVHFVDALVAEIAVAGVPEPVPVVVKAVAVDWPFRRRTKPEVVVHLRQIGGIIAGLGPAVRRERERLAGIHRTVGVLPDRIAPLVAETARHVDLADLAIPHALHGFLQGG